MRTWLHNNFLNIPNQQSWLHGSFLNISKPLTFHMKSTKIASQQPPRNFKNMNSQNPHELKRAKLQARRSKRASNFSQPTCKAATRVEVTPPNPKPATRSTPKPAASIEQSNNRLPSIPPIPNCNNFLQGCQQVAIGRHRSPSVTTGTTNCRANFFKNITQVYSKYKLPSFNRFIN